MQRTRAVTLAIVLPLLLGARCTQQPDSNDAAGQGWSEAQTIAWYTTSQGSRLIPRSWLHALEQPDAAAPFLDPAYMAGFRYLPSPAAGWKSPDPSCPIDPALPLGFTVDCQPDEALRVTKLRWMDGQSDREPWVGMNCSACHTAALEYQGQRVVIEGGPTIADFQSFTEKLDQALQATLADQGKFARFSAGVLGHPATPTDMEMLRGQVALLLGWDQKLAALNDAPIRYGFGRLDAIGHIFNKVALEALPDDAAEQIANPSDAPVSYPFLWNVTQLDRVEWDGIAKNLPVGVNPGMGFDAGALGRNTGEVIGVFADITIKPKPGLGGYASSINEPHLVGMEEQLQTLRPPKWPAAFPAIDTALAATGAALFTSQHCDDCHAVPAATWSVSDRYKVALTPVGSATPQTDHPVGTDMWMACNAVFDRAKTGAFQGTPLEIVSGAEFGANSDNLGLVQAAAIGSLLGKKQDVVATAFEGIFGINRGLPLPTPNVAVTISPKEARRAQCSFALTHKTAPNAAELVYKGRPLQGIWATPPYLHNGSVPTLYDLLLPPDQRPKTFFTGARAFDPVKVGYVTAKSAENGFEFDTVDAAGKPIDGNSNAGHDYNNAALTDAQRRALVEYMKTL